MDKRSPADCRHGKFEAVLERFDENGSDSLTPDDARTALGSFGCNPSPEEFSAMLAEIGTDANGLVRLSRLIPFVVQKMPLSTLEKEVRCAFRHFDKDGDGYISARELKQALSKLGESLTEEEVKEMIADADLDGDGRVSYPEFRQVMLSPSGHLNQQSTRARNRRAPATAPGNSSEADVGQQAANDADGSRQQNQDS